MIKNVCHFMVKYSALSVLLLTLNGCSGGGDGGGGGGSNPTVYPSVAGRYSFNTSSFKVSCSDGSTGTNPAIALNIDVSQKVNVITLINAAGTPEIPGLTILDSTSASGNVQTNSSFIATQIATANITGISGTVTLNYSQTGSFTSNGWNGTYTYRASSASLGSCTFIASFSGSKISSRTATKVISAPYDFENVQVDLYDSFSAIASRYGNNSQK